MSFKVGDLVRIKDSSDFRDQGYLKGEKRLGKIIAIGELSSYKYSVVWEHRVYGGFNSRLDYGYNEEDIELDEEYEMRRDSKLGALL